MTLRGSVRPVGVEGKSLSHVPSPQPERRYLGPEASNATSGSSPPGTRRAPASRLLEGTVPEGHGEVHCFKSIHFRWLLGPLLPCFQPSWRLGPSGWTIRGQARERFAHAGCGSHSPTGRQPHARESKPAERSLCGSAGLRLASQKCQGEDSAAGRGRRREGVTLCSAAWDETKNRRSRLGDMLHVRSQRGGRFGAQWVPESATGSGTRWGCEG